MCKTTSLFYWLLRFLLEECCAGSKNRMAEVLDVDRQTMRRAFRRAEQDAAHITPMVAEQLMSYYFTHKNLLDRAVSEYNVLATAVTACPQVFEKGIPLTKRLEGPTDIPQYTETRDIIERLQHVLGCTPQDNKSRNIHFGVYCQLYSNCPLLQLVALYNRYLSKRYALMHDVEGVGMLDL